MNKNLKRLFSMLLVIPMLGGMLSSSIGAGTTSASAENEPFAYTHFGKDSTINDSWTGLAGQTKVAGSVNSVGTQVDLSYDEAEDAVKLKPAAAGHVVDLYFDAKSAAVTGENRTFAILLKTTLTTSIFTDSWWFWSLTSPTDKNMGSDFTYDTTSVRGYTLAYVTTNVTISGGVYGMRLKLQNAEYTLYSCGLFASADAAKAYYADYYYEPATPLAVTHFGADSVYNNTWSPLTGVEKQLGSINAAANAGVTFSYDGENDVVSMNSTSNSTSVDMYFDARYAGQVSQTCYLAFFVKTDIEDSALKASNLTGIYNQNSNTITQGHGDVAVDSSTVAGYKIVYRPLTLSGSSIVYGLRFTPQKGVTNFYSAGVFNSVEDAQSYYAHYDSEAPAIPSVECVPTDSSLIVMLNATDNATDAENISYTVYADLEEITSANYKDAAYKTTVTGAASMATITVPGGKSYYVAVVAKDENRNSSFLASTAAFEVKSITPLTLNDLGGNTVISANGSSGNVAGELVYNSSVTCTRNENGVKVTRNSSDPWVAVSFDEKLTIDSAKTYTFAVLADPIAFASSGYFYKNFGVDSVITDSAQRPNWTVKDIAVNGATYRLLTATMAGNVFTNDTTIGAVRVAGNNSNGTSYNLYGVGVFENEAAALAYAMAGYFFDDVDYSSETDKSTSPSVYAKFDAKDIGGLKPTGTYSAAAGSIWLGNEDGATLEYDTDYQAARGYSSSTTWFGIQFDSHYVVKENTPYYVAILYTPGSASFKKLDAYAGYSFYDYRFEDSFTLYKDANGDVAGRLNWKYRYVDTVNGKDRYVAYALVEDVAATTTVLHSRTGVEEQGTTKITGIQVPFRAQENYYLYSAGIFEDYDSALYTLTDSTAPVINAEPTFTVEDSNITVNLQAANATDNLIADSKLTYKLYMSTEPITEDTELTIPASVTFGNDDAVLEYLEYGAGYYFALEVLDEAGNVATWIGEDKIRTQVKQGDTNADTYINESDLLTVRQKLLGKIENFNSDVNEDTNVNVKDLVALKKIEDNVLTFGELGLTRPNVVNGADVIFGTYQNMDQLVEHPESWTFSQMYGDGVLLHEAYWLHDWSPQSTTGEALSNILNARENLKVYLEYGMPKESTCITTDEETGEVTGVLVDDGGTTWGTNNYSIFKNKVDTFIANTGINIDVLNLEFYSNAVYNSLRGLNKSTNWQNHEDGVAYTLNAYNSFYDAFVANESYKNIKINHVGCPNLTALWGGTESTYPRYWKESAVAGNYGEGSYWGSYQACDITLPILNAERTDDRHIGYVSDSPWNSFDTGKLSNGEQNQVIRETITALEGLNKNLNSSLIVGDWDDSFNTDETITDEQIDKFFWENSLKSIFNAQYNDAYHSAYFIESYWDGPYTMLSEDEKYSYANLVATAIRYLKGIGQDLDLTISDGTTTKGSGEYGNTPMKSQLFEKTEDEKTYTVTITNNGEFVCNPWLRAVKSVGDNDATITYKYNGEDITSQITSADGFTFKDLFEKDGKFDSYTESTDAVLDTDFDNENHGLEVGASVEIEITVSGGNDGAVALCGFYNPQDSTNTIKDVVTITY